MTMKLKNCPFCGGEADLSQKMFVSGDGSKTYVKCKTCGATSQTHIAYDMDDDKKALEAAADTWNRRTAEKPVLDVWEMSELYIDTLKTADIDEVCWDKMLVSFITLIAPETQVHVLHDILENLVYA